MDRHVVRLKTVCWLSFKKEFPKIPKGKYLVSVVFGLNQDLYWPDDHNFEGNAKLKVRNESSDPPLDLIEAEFKPSYWKQIKNNKFNNFILKGQANVISISSNSNPKWFKIELKPFEICEESADLSFEWRDVDNPWWKQGMSWDYVEIKSLY